jgi:hypothetical protein
VSLVPGGAGRDLLSQPLLFVFSSLYLSISFLPSCHKTRSYIPPQDQFYEYLEERGVTDALVKYLYGLVFDKEQREYVAWLGRVKKFLEQK